MQKQTHKLLWLLVGLLGLLLTGCAGSSATTPPQQIVIGENTDLGGYDPGTTMSPFIRTLVFNSLVELDADFKLVPALAERWTMSPDGKTWTFTLRQGVKFHDGAPLTATVVKQNLERLRAGSGKVWLMDVTSVEARGEHVVQVVMNKPSFTFASDLAVPFLSIVGPSGVDAAGKVVKAIGTGPYSLESWQKDQQFVLKRNPSYWGGSAKNEKLVFKVIRDPDSRAMALEAGSVDLISLRQSLTAATRLSGNPKLKMEKRLGQTSEIMFLNVNSPALQELAVRQAIGHSLNIGKLVPSLLGVNAEAGKTFFSPAYGDYALKDETTLPYDPDRARQLLAGKSLKLRLAFGAKNAEDSLLAGAIQSELKAVGVAAALEPLEDAALMDALKKKNYDLIMLGQSFVPHDEPSSHYRRGYYHPLSTFDVYRTPELTGLIDRLFATAEPAERLHLHHRIQATIAGAMPVIVLFHRNNIVAMKQQVMGYKVSVGTWQLYRGLTEAYVQP